MAAAWISTDQTPYPSLNQHCHGQTGWPKSRKKFPEFSKLFQSHNLLFHRLLQQKVNVIMTFIKGHSTSTPARSPPHSDQGRYSWDPNDPVYPVNSCFTQIFEWRTNNTLFVTIFPWGCKEIPENSLTFHDQRNPWVFQVFQVCGHPVKLCLWLYMQTVACNDFLNTENDFTKSLWQRTAKINMYLTGQWLQLLHNDSWCEAVHHLSMTGKTNNNRVLVWKQPRVN